MSELSAVAAFLWVERVLQPAVGRLTEVTAPSGEAVLAGLARDLARVESFDDGWERLCCAAWALGFSSVHLAPTPSFALAIPAFDVAGPAPAPRRDHRDLGVDSAWSFKLCAAGQHAATLCVRLGSDMLDFNPGGFAEAAQSLVRRFVGARAGASAGDGVS